MPVEISDRGLTCLILYQRPQADMAKLAGKDPAPLLCAGTRFLVEHQLHWLGDQGFKQVRLALNDRSKPTETVVGDGLRWGANVSYAYDAQHLSLMSRLRKHLGLAKEGLLLLEGNALMRFAMEDSFTSTTLFQSGQQLLPILFCSPADWVRVVEECVATDILSICEWVKEYLKPEIHEVTAYFHQLNSMQSFIRMNQEMLRNPDAFHFRGEEIQPGVRCGRRTKISEKATFQGPVTIGDETYIKSGASIGPNVFVGHNSLIERDVQLSDSVIGPDTYIGRNTSFQGKYVCRNYVVDLVSGTAVFIDDPIILADLTRSGGIALLIEQLIALTLLIGTLPLTIILLPFHRLLFGSWVIKEHVLIQPVARNLKSGYDFQWMNWFRFKFGWFVLDALPSLANIVSGKLKFVGNPPLSVEDVSKLDGLFLGDMLRGKAGLTGMIQQQSGEILTQDDVFATTIYYNATRSVMGDLKLFLKAFIPGIHRFKRNISYETHDY